MRSLRLAIGAAVLVAPLFLGVGPAGAHDLPPGFDPLLPSPITTSVDQITPADAAPLFTFQPEGGLAEFAVSGTPGHDIVVLGYNDEPYLRIDAEQNTFTSANSPSTYLNGTTAGGRDTIPPRATATATPRWEATPLKGKVAWHDHRIHWMQPGPPPTRPGTDVIQTWEVHLEVDHRPVTINGALHHNPEIPWSNYQIAVAGPVASASSTPPTSGLSPFAIVAIVSVLMALAFPAMLLRRHIKAAAAPINKVRRVWQTARPDARNAVRHQ